MNDIFSYDWNSIGKRIKSEREKVGMSQSNFAEYCGLQRTSRGTVGEWEKGKRLPDLEALLKMCELFECELGYILCEKGYKNKTREKTDIVSALNLNAQAVSTLLWLAHDAGRREFIENLLSAPGELYGISIAYQGYKKILSCEQLAALDVESDDMVLGPCHRPMLAVEADIEKEFALFRLQKAIVAFAEKDK